MNDRAHRREGPPGFPDARCGSRATPATTQPTCDKGSSYALLKPLRSSATSSFALRHRHDVRPEHGEQERQQIAGSERLVLRVKYSEPCTQTVYNKLSNIHRLRVNFLPVNISKLRIRKVI